jgi:hypothetical protein
MQSMIRDRLGTALVLHLSTARTVASWVKRTKIKNVPRVAGGSIAEGAERMRNGRSGGYCASKYR